MTTPKVEPPKDEITPRLKLAKILLDYKEETVDYIRTSRAIEAIFKLQQEALLDRVEAEARIDEDWLDRVLEQYWKQRHGMYNANQDDVEMANREAKDAIANKIVELVLKDRKSELRKQSR